MTAIVAMLPDWYCYQYVRGDVSYWTSIRALAALRFYKIWKLDPAHLEWLNLMSLLSFVFLVRQDIWTSAHIGLMRIAGPVTWGACAAALVLIQIGAILSVRRRSTNRAAALTLCGVWWLLVCALSYVSGALILSLHVTTPWLAIGCILSSSQLKTGDGHGQEGC